MFCSTLDYLSMVSNNLWSSLSLNPLADMKCLFSTHPSFPFCYFNCNQIIYDWVSMNYQTYHCCWFLSQFPLVEMAYIVLIFNRNKWYPFHSNIILFIDLIPGCFIGVRFPNSSLAMEFVLLLQYFSFLIIYSCHTI